jgi:hypothetical protein
VREERRREEGSGGGDTVPRSLDAVSNAHTKPSSCYYPVHRFLGRFAFNSSRLSKALLAVTTDTNTLSPTPSAFPTPYSHPDKCSFDVHLYRSLLPVRLVFGLPSLANSQFHLHRKGGVRGAQTVSCTASTTSRSSALSACQRKSASLRRPTTKTYYCTQPTYTLSTCTKAGTDTHTKCNLKLLIVSDAGRAHTIVTGITLSLLTDCILWLRPMQPCKVLSEI